MDSQRYQQLKGSVHALRSQVRVKTPCSHQDTADSHPHQAFTDNCSRIGLPIDPAGLKGSASMQLLQLQFNILNQERQEELVRLQNKATEKLKQLEAFRAKCERQIKKAEDNYYSLKEQFRKLDNDAYERVSAAEQDFLCQEATLAAKFRQVEDEQRQREDHLTANYEAAISSLKKDYDKNNMSKKALEDHLKRVMNENHHLRERIMLLELEFKSAKEEFRNMYRQQEKEWNMKIVTVTETQEAEVESLRSAIDKEREKFEAERLQFNSEFQDYKSHKVIEIDCLERHIRLALESKDARIMQLKGQLQKLQEQLEQTTHLFQEAP